VVGLCPGTKVSGGKVLSARTRRSTNRVRQALKLAAMSLSRNDSALGAFYRRLCSRMDKPRANTAVAHSLARMVYFMLTGGEAFVDQGQQHYEEQQRQRSIDALRRRDCARLPDHPSRANPLKHGVILIVSQEKAWCGPSGVTG
jgi:transposase